MIPAAKSLICMAGLLCISLIGNSQILKNIGNHAKQKAEQKANQKIDETIDKGINKTVEGTKKKDTSVAPPVSNTKTSPVEVNNQTTASTETTGFKTYSKFDFIPGDKIIAYDDFSEDAIGDFPVKWNTNSTGEVVTVQGQTGKWLMISKKGRYIPEHINSLPENCTVQFDLMCSEKFNFYSNALELFLLTGPNGKEALEDYSIELQKRSGVKLFFHPTNAGMTGGTVAVETWENGTKVVRNEVATNQFHSYAGKDKIKVSIWRQKQRMRVYINEEKVFDLPRAFTADQTYSTLLFQIWMGMNNDKDRYLLNNIKVASGAPDTRNKLITEGKFVTRGILFDVNSDKIKPESYGVLKDIANTLTENGSVKVKIVGHTDADGNDADNLTLSKQRAESVKNNLVKDFGIDASRLETDGKGESQPIDKNTTAEGKANNRRVEFIKL